MGIKHDDELDDLDLVWDYDVSINAFVERYVVFFTEVLNVVVIIRTEGKLSRDMLIMDEALGSVGGGKLGLSEQISMYVGWIVYWWTRWCFKLEWPWYERALFCQERRSPFHRGGEWEERQLSMNFHTPKASREEVTSSFHILKFELPSSFNIWVILYLIELLDIVKERWAEVLSFLKKNNVMIVGP